MNIGKSFIRTQSQDCDNDTRGMSCEILGDYYMQANSVSMASNWALEPRPAAARAAYIRSCELGWGPGCSRIVEFRLARDSAELERFRRRAIELGAPPRTDDEVQADLAKERLDAAQVNAELAARKSNAPGLGDILGAASGALELKQT